MTTSREDKLVKKVKQLQAALRTEKQKVKSLTGKLSTSKRKYGQAIVDDKKKVHPISV